MAASLNPTERLIRMSDNDAPKAAAIMQAVDELADIREYGAACTELADLLEEIGQHVEDWQTAESRDEKADARDELMSALEQVQEYVSNLQGLGSLGDLIDL